MPPNKALQRTGLGRFSGCSLFIARFLFSPSLSLIRYRDMKSRSSLLGEALCGLTKSCFSQQVLHGSRRLAGGSQELVPRVWSLPGNVVNLEASIRVSALESDGMVKLIKHSQASSPRTSHTRLIKAWTKMVRGQVRTLNDSPTRMMKPPVYRVDLTLPVRNVEHGKAVLVSFPPWPVQGQSTVRQTQGRRHGEDRTSQRRCVIQRIRP